MGGLASTGTAIAATNAASAAHEAFKAGLEGIVAGLTTITFLDGQKGQMLYKGYSAIELGGAVGGEVVGSLNGVAQGWRELAEAMAWLKMMPRSTGAPPVSCAACPARLS